MIGKTNAIAVVGSGGTSEEQEYQPNADMVWARQVCENDVQEGFGGKVLQMIGDLSPTSLIQIPKNGAVKTSDGGYYTNDSSTSILKIEHTWNDTNARVSESYQGRYNKVRWAITYYKDRYIQQNNVGLLTESIYLCLDNVVINTTTSYLSPTISLVEYMDFINNVKRPIRNNYFFSQASSLKAISKGLDCSNVEAFNGEFYECSSLETIPLLDTSNATNMQNMFYECSSLETIPLLDTSKVTNMRSMFDSCIKLKKVHLANTSSVTDMQNMFRSCSKLKTVYLSDTSNVTNMYFMFYSCSLLETIPLLDTSSVTDMSQMFTHCSSLVFVPALNTENVTKMSYMFSNCSKLKIIGKLDLIKTTNVSSIFNECAALTNLNLKNIKISLQIGNGTRWGHLLTLDSLTNTIKELWDLTGSTSQTLTVGTANLEKLANVYVKLIDITDEMRAEDEYIDNKKPFVVCESTDEGAMLISEYVTSKNWQLK